MTCAHFLDIPHQFHDPMAEYICFRSIAQPSLEKSTEKLWCWNIQDKHQQNLEKKISVEVCHIEFICFYKMLMNCVHWKYLHYFVRHRYLFLWITRHCLHYFIILPNFHNSSQYLPCWLSAPAWILQGSLKLFSYFWEGDHKNIKNLNRFFFLLDPSAEKL